MEVLFVQGFLLGLAAGFLVMGIYLAYRIERL